MAKHYMHFDCSRAIRELNLPQSPVETAVTMAVNWFEKNGYVNSGSSARAS
jgi:dihydroflavonol-4-reductase